jgi:benzoyl-CoA reductase/2-hydroxyglutaryl-CoA dehydratase subunit BcrC/BadD/HgdB
MKQVDTDFYKRILSFGHKFKGYAGLEINAALAGMQLAHLEQEANGELPVVWTSPLVPSEILTSFGVGSVTPETVAAFLASAGKGGELLLGSEANFHNGDCCSFQRIAVMALINGLVPVPQAFVATVPICDDNPRMSDFLSQKYGREYFLIDVPATGDQATVDYAVAQLRDFILFLEKLTGQKLSPERLAAAIMESNRTRFHWRRANELRQSQPPVIYGVAPLRMTGGLLLQKLGSPELSAAMAGYENELSQRISARKFLSCRHRLLWLHLFPLFDNKFMQFIEVELGMMVVFEESSDVWWEEIDPVDPLPGLARRIVGAPMAGPVGHRIDSILKMIKDYDIDGVVNFSHVGCKSLTGGVGFLASAIKKAGIPFLELSGDCLDNRSPATAQWRSRLEAFKEILD